LATREASLNLLFLDLAKAVAAGRLFLSSLASKNPSAVKSGRQTVQFIDGGTVLRVEYVPLEHKAAIANIAAEYATKISYVKVEPKNIRQDRWERWQPTIHISAAVALLYDANVQAQGPLQWLPFCKSLLSDGNGQVARVIRNNANDLLQAAEDCRLFPKANPRPVFFCD